MKYFKIKSIALSLFVFSLLFIGSSVFAADAKPDAKPAAIDKPAFTLDWKVLKVEGEADAVQVNIKVKKGHKLNKEFPTKVKFKAPEEISFAKETLKMVDFESFTEKEATVKGVYKKKDVKVKAEVEVDLRFGTCAVADGKTKSCMLQHEKVKVMIP